MAIVCASLFIRIRFALAEFIGANVDTITAGTQIPLLMTDIERGNVEFISRVARILQRGKGAVQEDSKKQMLSTTAIKIECLDWWHTNRKKWQIFDEEEF